MKKIFVYMASAALVFAASCNKIEEANTPVDTPAETELITVELNPQTKTSLDDMSTVWTEKDAVSVTAGGEQIGTLTLVSGSTFKGAIKAGLDGKTVVTLNYPAGVTEVPAEQKAVDGSFANGAALLEGTTTVAKLRAKEGATLANTTALLQFSVAQAGDVTFEVGTTKYTVTGCKTGETYYACVAPATAAFTARIDGYLSRKAAENVTFTANKIANLGALPAPVESSVELRGDAPLSWSSGVKLYEDIDCFVLKNVTFTASQGFKFVNNSTWLQGAIADNKWAVLKENGGNMKLSAGNYDIYISKTVKVARVVTAGSPSPELIKPESDYMYLLPSDNWLESNAHFAAWIWKDNAGGKVYNFTEHPNVAGLYRVKLNGGNKMILFRMSPDRTYNDGNATWPGDDHWFKSGDLIIGNNNLYTVINWNANGSGLSKVDTLL